MNYRVYGAILGFFIACSLNAGSYFVRSGIVLFQSAADRIEAIGFPEVFWLEGGEGWQRLLLWHGVLIDLLFAIGLGAVGFALTIVAPPRTGAAHFDRRIAFQYSLWAVFTVLGGAALAAWAAFIIGDGKLIINALSVGTPLGLIATRSVFKSPSVSGALLFSAVALGVVVVLGPFVYVSTFDAVIVRLFASWCMQWTVYFWFLRVKEELSSVFARGD